MQTHNLKLDIPAEAFEPTGPDDDKTGRLLCTVWVNGVAFHAEAWAVMEREDTGEQTLVPHDYADDETIAALYTINDQAMQTLEINGREYILFVYPHGA